ncbi:SRPBCC family protein [Amycolatopsis alba]|nr:SRPBCC family protein [Amycolatopsis alba]
MGFRVGDAGYAGVRTDYRHTATIEMSADDLFAYLREPRNLPRYFPQMTQAEPGGGDAVHVEAEVHGEHVEGEAWLKVDEDNRSLRWGAQGPHDYQGELSIEEAGPATSSLTVTLHSVRDADDGEVQRGLEGTVAALAHTATSSTTTSRCRRSRPSTGPPSRSPPAPSPRSPRPPPGDYRLRRP